MRMHQFIDKNRRVWVVENPCTRAEKSANSIPPRHQHLHHGLECRQLGGIWTSPSPPRLDPASQWRWNCWPNSGLPAASSTTFALPWTVHLFWTPNWISTSYCPPTHSKDSSFATSTGRETWLPEIFFKFCNTLNHFKSSQDSQV